MIHSLTPLLVRGAAIALTAGLLLTLFVGCASDEKQQGQLFGESFATEPGTARDPGVLAGTWVGERLGGDGTVTLTFIVDGNAYTGTFETQQGAGGTIEGTISGSEWTGTATQTKPVGPYNFKLGGMYSAKSITWSFSGTGFFGKQEAMGFAHKQ
jgi:hypothetical protein